MLSSKEEKLSGKRAPSPPPFQGWEGDGGPHSLGTPKGEPHRKHRNTPDIGLSTGQTKPESENATYACSTFKHNLERVAAEVWQEMKKRDS